jgi:hypothetical protein
MIPKSGNRFSEKIMRKKKMLGTDSDSIVAGQDLGRVLIN